MFAINLDCTLTNLGKACGLRPRLEFEWNRGQLEVTFGIFDAFESDEGREAHLKGPIAAALMQHAAQSLAQAPEIRRAEVLADKLAAGK
jgi:quinol monooxygenase YgiN